MFRFCLAALQGLALPALMALPAAGLHAAEEEAGAEKKDGAAAYTFPKPGESRLIKDMDEALRIPKVHGSELLVVNYWATWCGPCVEELPYFIALSKAYPEEKIRVVGYSLDFEEVIESDVDPFLKERAIPYANIVIAVDPNEYVPRVSEEWSGAIPATFFYNAEGERVGQLLTAVDAAELFDKVGELIGRLGIDVEPADPPEPGEAGGEG